MRVARSRTWPRRILETLDFLAFLAVVTPLVFVESVRSRITHKPPKPPWTWLMGTEMPEMEEG